MKKKTPIPYRVVNWDFNRDCIEFYDVMPYLLGCWDEEKKRKHKIWSSSSLSDLSPELKGKVDDTRMPETFDEFKKFVLDNSMYQFWARCEYEVIVHGWPVRKNDHKMDVYEQIKNNADVVTKVFMENVGAKIA